MYTLKYIVEDWFNSIEDSWDENRIWSAFWINFGTFLDSVYRDPKIENIWEEPDIDFSRVLQYQYAFYAGAVDAICDKYGFKRPDWIYKNKYFCEEPYFAGHAKEELRVFLLVETPRYFKVRNMYLEHNVLFRV